MQNAFSEFFSGVNQIMPDTFEMLVVDQMHEFELGVWKALLKHLIRMLYAQGTNSVDKLNARYVTDYEHVRSHIYMFLL